MNTRDKLIPRSPEEEEGPLSFEQETPKQKNHARLHRTAVDTPKVLVNNVDNTDTKHSQL